MSAPDFPIRSLAPTDLPSLVRIEQAVHIQPWPTADLERSLRPPYRSWVIEADDAVVGYAIFQWLPHEATLMNIAVDKAQQGGGIATTLLTAVISVATTAEVEAIFLEVRESNHAAIRLYENLGFVEIDRRQDYYASASGSRHPCEDALVMSLPILS